MNDRKRFLYLLLIMTTVALLVMGITDYILYQAAFKEEQERLVETVQSQARFIEAVARFDAIYSNDYPDGSYSATVSQIIEAHKNYKGFGETGEFTLARLEGDSIVFLLSHRHYDLEKPQSIPFDTELAEPMQRALSGESGTIIGLDYRGENVLAAYEPVAMLHLGLVAKIDLSEIRAPFIRASLIAFTSALMIVLIGSLVFLRISNPVLQRLREYAERLEKMVAKRTRKLQESELRLKEAQQIARLGSWEWNIKDNSEIWSDEQFNIFGYNPGEITPTYQHFLDAIHPEDYDYVVDAVQKTLDEKQPYQIEFRIIRPDQEVRTILAQGQVYQDQQNQPVRMIGIVQDITERKITEESLRVSEERYRTLFETTREGIMASGPDGRIVSANQAAATTFGYKKPEDLIGKPAIEIYVDNGQRTKLFEELTKTGYVDNYELSLLKKDGTQLYVLLSAVIQKDLEGNVLRTEAILHDITERKQAEEELKKLSEAVEQSPDMVFITNPNSKIEYVNPAFTEITGYSAEDAIGATPTILNSGEMSEEYFQQFWSTILSGTTFRSEVINRKKNGELFIYDQTITPLKDADGNTINFISTGKDITERVESHKMLEKALQEANQANKVKDLFLANMSHEIRTPLNSILGFSEIIEDSFKDRMDEQESEYFQIINGSSQRLINTVHEILDISQIEAGTVPYNPRVVRLATAVEWIFKEFRPKAEEKNLEFTYDNRIDDGAVKVDESSIVKAISNLVDNAIKYTEEGQIKIRLNEQNGKYVLSISDTGIGIGADYQKHLYDIFSQESTGYTKKYQGLGLGLSIAKRYLDLNDVPIAVESKQGVGTTFSLTFIPADMVIDEIGIKTVDAKIEKTVSKEKPVVLLVEDDLHNRKTLEVILKGKYETPGAVSVAEAKKQLREHKVDLILLDLSLEGDEDGLDLVAYMKADAGLKDIPVIAVTAHAFTTDRDNCLTAGCNDYMAKPIKKNDLLTIIKKYIPIKN